MAETNNNEDFDDLSDIDALLEEVSREELDPDLSGFEDGTEGGNTDRAVANTTLNDITQESSVTDSLSLPDDQIPADQEQRNSADLAVAGAAGAAAGAAIASKGSTPAREPQPTPPDERSNDSLFRSDTQSSFDQFTGRDEKEFQSKQKNSAQLSLTHAQEASLKKTKAIWLALSIATLALALGALITSSLAWMNSGSPALTTAVQLQNESMEQQRLLLQSINQQIVQLEQKVEVTRLMMDDVIAGQSSALHQAQREIVPDAVTTTPATTSSNALPAVNTQELQRRIERVQRTANIIQSRLGQMNQQVEQLSQQQLTATQAVRELEKAWLEQVLATKEQEEFEAEAEASPGIAPDAYRYVAPANQFSFP
jgi:hypothetical protein